MLFRFKSYIDYKHKQNSLRVRTTDICKKVNPKKIGLRVPFSTTPKKGLSRPAFKPHGDLIVQVDSRIILYKRQDLRENNVGGDAKDKRRNENIKKSDDLEELIYAKVNEIIANKNKMKSFFFF